MFSGLYRLIERKSGCRYGLLVLAFLLLLVSPARAEPGYLGLSIQEVSADMAAALSLSGPRGILVRDVSLDGAANAAGIRRGDLLIKMNGETVTTVKQAIKVLSQLQAGDQFQVEGLQSGKPHQWTVKLGPWPPSRRVTTGSFGSIAPLGLTMAAITPKIRERFSLRWGSVGVLVSLIDEESLIAIDLVRGEVIRRVNHENVWTPKQVMDAYQAAKDDGRKTLLLLVEGLDGYRFVPLPVL